MAVPLFDPCPPDSALAWRRVADDVTLAYSAPELLHGPATPASDMWSFGMLLCEMMIWEVRAPRRGGAARPVLSCWFATQATRPTLVHTPDQLCCHARL
eukprot:252911-Chlamydomonas_euryale.AAC.1